MNEFLDTIWVGDELIFVDDSLATQDEAIRFDWFSRWFGNGSEAEDV